MEQNASADVGADVIQLHGNQLAMNMRALRYAHGVAQHEGVRMTIAQSGILPLLMWLAMPLLTVSSATQPSSSPATATEKVNVAPLQLMVYLTDGSRLLGETALTSLPLRSEALGNLEIPLARIRTVKFSPNHGSATLTLVNGDRIDGVISAGELPLRTLFGPVKIPTVLAQDIRILVAGAANVALSKQVTAQEPGSVGHQLPADRLTDGNQETEAFPGASAFDYTVDLLICAAKDCAAEAASFDVQAVVIHWGKFGRHFPGAKQADGSWVPAAYPADYVNWYRVDYMTSDSKDWRLLHESNGRPTDENVAGVVVTRDPPTATASEGNVTTTLADLTLHDVVAARLRAKGEHWIGVYELEVQGSASGRSSSGSAVPGAKRL
jgi:hypothetical protein